MLLGYHCVDFSYINDTVVCERASCSAKYKHSRESSIAFVRNALQSHKAVSANPLGFVRADCFESPALLSAGDGASKDQKVVGLHIRRPRPRPDPISRILSLVSHSSCPISHTSSLIPHISYLISHISYLVSYILHHCHCQSALAPLTTHF